MSATHPADRGHGAEPLASLDELGRIRARRPVLRVSIERTGAVLAAHVELAASFRERLIGLLGRSSLPVGHGLLILGCRSIHTGFMRFPIDAVFLGREGHVVSILSSIEPWRVSRLVWRAHSVLELTSGAAQRAGLNVTDRLLVSCDGRAPEFSGRSPLTEG